MHQKSFPRVKLRMRATCRYTQQASNLYLAVVHIWDKLYGFPFVPRRDPMPEDCTIDNIVDFECENEDDEDNTSNAVLRTSLPGENNLNRMALRNSNSQSK